VTSAAPTDGDLRHPIGPTATDKRDIPARNHAGARVTGHTFAMPEFFPVLVESRNATIGTDHQFFTPAVDFNDAGGAPRLPAHIELPPFFPLLPAESDDRARFDRRVDDHQIFEEANRCPRPPSVGAVADPVLPDLVAVQVKGVHPGG